MDKSQMFKITMRIDPVDCQNGLKLEDEVSSETLARICRKDMKFGGGCPVGHVLCCPFFYEPYRKRHEGERPLQCREVKADDWNELYSIIKEDDGDINE